jgi:AAA domain-containing protein
VTPDEIRDQVRTSARTGEAYQEALKLHLASTVAKEDAVHQLSGEADDDSAYRPVDILSLTAPDRPTIVGVWGTDRCLLYPGKLATAFGDGGSAKSWLGKLCVSSVLGSGRRAAWIDYESQADVMAEHLHMCGGVSKAATRERFAYFNGRGMHDAQKMAAAVLATAPGLVVIDAFQGMKDTLCPDGSSNDTDAVSKVLTVARALADAGPAVLVIDHTTKDSDGKKAGGSAQKHNEPDITFNVVCVKPFAVGINGHSQVIVRKYRSGYYAQDQTVAFVQHQDGKMSLPGEIRRGRAEEIADTEGNTVEADADAFMKSAAQLREDIILSRIGDMPGHRSHGGWAALLSSSETSAEVKASRPTWHRGIAALKLAGKLTADDDENLSVTASEDATA